MKSQKFEHFCEKMRIEVEGFQNFLDTRTSRGKSAGTTPNRTAKNLYSSKLIQKDFRMRPKSGNSEKSSQLASSRKNFRTTANLESSNLNLKSLGSAETCKNLEKTASILEFHDNSEKFSQIQKEILRYVRESVLFTHLKQEFQDFYDLARSSDCNFTQTEGLSIYFALQEELEKDFPIKIDNLENELKKIVAKSLNFSKELVKVVKSKGDKDSAIVIDYLTRYHLKAIDRTYQILMKTVENLEKINLDTAENWKDAKKKDIERIRETFEKKSAGNQEEVERLKVQNDELKSIISKLRAEIIEKEKEICKLTEIDHGFSAMQSMDHLLKSLDTFINDTKDQRKQKSKMILNFQEFFSSVEQVNRPLKSTSTESQTSWSISTPKIPIRLLDFPITTSNILAKLAPVSSESELNSMKEQVIDSILNTDPAKGFLFTLCDNIFPFFNNSNEKINALYQTALQLTAGDENWKLLGMKLLGIGKETPKIVEKALRNLIKVFAGSLDLENSETFLPASEFISIVEKKFKDYPKFQSWILSKMVVYFDSGFAGKIENRFSAFCMRFALSFERLKENLKQSLEKFCKVKTGLGKSYLVSFEVFYKFLTKKVKLVCIIQEIYEIWEYLKPDLYNTVLIVKIVQELNFSFNLQQVKKSSVSILDFLLISSEFFAYELKKCKKHIKKIPEYQDIESLSSFLSLQSINFQPASIPIILNKLLLQEPLNSIVESYSLYPKDLFSLSEVNQKPSKPSKSPNSKYIN